VRKPCRRNNRKKLLIPALLLCFAAALVYISANLKPVVTSVCSSQAKVLATTAINRAVVNELKQTGASYHDLVKIEYDVYGSVSAIGTDAVEINMLQSQLTDAVNRELSAIETRDISIPIGTLTGVQLLSGRGPDIKLKMIPSSFAVSDLVNKFDSAGINQTRHRIMIEFTVSMVVIVAPYTTTADVTLTVPIAETVIIGAVPDSFAEIGSTPLINNGSE